MIYITENSPHCCGCSACASACQVSAIKMKQDRLGFFYPVVDQTLCVNCGRCDIVCNFTKKHDRSATILYAAAFQSKNNEVLRQSSSGGAFIEISDRILSCGGVVYGAVFDEPRKEIRHIEACSISERNKMCGSKYVQSNMAGIYKKIKKRVDSNIPVLFTGTPCQCAAVVSYLGDHPSNLTLIDLLCHGVPSPAVFKDHLLWCEKRLKAKITEYKFRDKRYGYLYTHSASLDNNTQVYNIWLKRVLKLYSINMRESCYICPYASRHRYGDITIGDYWDAWQNNIQMTYRTGCSIIFANTPKGKTIITKLSDSCNIHEVDPLTIKQDALNKPVKKSVQVDAFRKVYLLKGYKAALDQFAPLTIKSWGYNTLQRWMNSLHMDWVLRNIESIFLNSWKKQ